MNIHDVRNLLVPGSKVRYVFENSTHNGVLVKKHGDLILEGHWKVRFYHDGAKVSVGCRKGVYRKNIKIVALINEDGSETSLICDPIADMTTEQFFDDVKYGNVTNLSEKLDPQSRHAFLYHFENDWYVFRAFMGRNGNTYTGFTRGTTYVCKKVDNKLEKIPSNTKIVRDMIKYLHEYHEKFQIFYI